VLVVRVEELVPKAVWKRRYGAINAFEQQLANEGTIVVKLYLHISRDEQAKRFRARVADRTKNWKFNADDLAKRAKWDEYMAAYEAAIAKTSTKSAPWHVVPADHKWVRDAVITEIVTQALEGLDLRWPELTPELRALTIE
jgi:polyphosphate kinase 2 (PPK2 family)